MKTHSFHTRPIVASGLLLGAGLGGFVDGILFHQLLQWHNMISGVRPPLDLVTMKVNMLWDGVFHAFTWLATVAGIVVLWRAGQRVEVVWSTRAFAGAIAVGAGLFNVIEGVIDHHLLGLHHVHPGAFERAWDLGFIGVGALLVIVGTGLVRAGRAEEVEDELTFGREHRV